MNLTPILYSQLRAAHAMLHECIERCPAEHWNGTIGKYPFWMVAYHTLCFLDVYLSRGDATWQPHAAFHPAGRAELDEEYPSRAFTQGELLAYSAFCHAKLAAEQSAETEAALAAPSGFPRLPFSRAELHIYNTRHVQHHAGQLAACLRRVGVDTRWVGRG